MKKLLTILCSAVLMSGYSVSLSAEEPADKGAPGYGREKLSEVLGLSAEQREQLGWHEKGQKWEMGRALFEERKKLNDMLREKSTSREAIYAQHEAVNQKQIEWNTLRLERILKAREILSEEQLNKLLEFHQRGAGFGPKGQGGGCFGKGMQHRMGGGAQGS